jgi:hypothetical protein
MKSKVIFAHPDGARSHRTADKFDEYEIKNQVRSVTMHFWLPENSGRSVIWSIFSGDNLSATTSPGEPQSDRMLTQIEANIFMRMFAERQWLLQRYRDQRCYSMSINRLPLGWSLFTSCTTRQSFFSI